MFRVGQKVICVGPGHWLHYGVAPNAPRRGGIYTIRWIGPRGGHLCLQFKGLINPPVHNGIMECAFRIQNNNGTINFRPVIERRTDISVFTAMLAPTSIRDLVKG
jgi:hypothetical protein